MSWKLQITLKYSENLDSYLKKNHPEVSDYRVISKSLDARRAPRGRTPKYHYTLECIDKNSSFPEKKETFEDKALDSTPIIIGAGPAGLFCALRLSEYGIPSIIIERGDEARNRMIKIAKHWRYGKFDTESNVCFGEGGAGLFSDGKLITRIKSPFIKYVMNKFVAFGAPKETAYVSNPHLGSNKIRNIITKIADYLREKGCQFYYNTRVDEILMEQDQAVGVKLNTGKVLKSSNIVLATGHSAKEIYLHLEELGVAMAPKDFAVGVRIEHPRKWLDQVQYGEFAHDGSLGAARYRVSYDDKELERGIYSFCMCPGGYVLSSGTDADGLVSNGMSNYSHNSPWSNSALVVTIKNGRDFNHDSKSLLAGLHYQRNIEHQAYLFSKDKASGKELPCMSIEEFFKGEVSQKPIPSNSVPSGLFKQNMIELFDRPLIEGLKHALEHFDQKMEGFAKGQTLLIGPETRTSAPVTILRDKMHLESVSHRGLYPCGEGAGHAGGITSAAVDGIKVAEAMVHKK